MMRRFAVVAALALASCSSSSSSSSSSSTSSTGGSTSAGTTTGGGTTTSSTSSTSTSSGSGSSGSSGTEPSCPTAQRWNGSACAPSREAYLYLQQTEFRYSDGGTDTNIAPYGELDFWRYTDAGGTEYSRSPPDTCTYTSVYYADAGNPDYASNYELFRADWGTLSVSGTQAGTLVFDLDGGPGLLGSAGFDGSRIFSGGEALTVTAAAGADFPALNTTVAVPSKLVMGTSPIVRGQPYTVTWTGSTTGGHVSFFGTAAGASGYWFFDCNVSDTGSYTLPASETAKIPTDVTGTFVRGSRATYVEILPPQDFVVQAIYVGWDAESALEVH